MNPVLFHPWLWGRISPVPDVNMKYMIHIACCTGTQPVEFKENLDRPPAAFRKHLILGCRVFYVPEDTVVLTRYLS